MSRRRVRRLPLCPSLRVAGRRAQPARRRRARERSSRLSAEPKGAASRLPAPMKGRSKGSVNSIPRLTQKIERNRHRISPRPQFFGRGGAHRRPAALPPRNEHGKGQSLCGFSPCVPLLLHKKRHPIGCLFYGADDQIRTDYLVLTKDALYLLSYISELAGAEGFEPSARGFGDHCSTN